MQNYNRIDYVAWEIVGPYKAAFIAEIGRSKSMQRMAIFRCSYCGQYFLNRITTVRSGRTKSCGCYKINNPGGRTHGLRRHQLYGNWLNIKNKCKNINAINFEHYGGRGITVCDEWVGDFESFLVYMISLPHAMEAGYTIDRYPDNNGNYEPGNVRWATRRQQSENTRNKRGGRKYVGIYKYGDFYISEIIVKGRKKILGKYKKEELAVYVRNEFIKNNRLRHKIQ